MELGPDVIRFLAHAEKAAAGRGLARRLGRCSVGSAYVGVAVFSPRSGGYAWFGFLLLMRCSGEGMTMAMHVVIGAVPVPGGGLSGPGARK
ncbi:hypothetical protein MXD61_07240 [Frankia sp. AgPm24]|uniref:hypothetical protein n=1 Tax=Frankia sp. AgPm24 TaxID=631128 RepID=UPI00200E90F4|nr:hypothetical protein [Frankia sp. AgPm24]MCK9921685.1 hypothetical protein [Frankia sp. AgPm24]